MRNLFVDLLIIFSEKLCSSLVNSLEMIVLEEFL